MLKPQTNVFDILKQLPALFGTLDDPRWALVWSPIFTQWSAIDCNSPAHLVEVATDPNWIAVCMALPVHVDLALKHARPDLICQDLHRCATQWRAKAVDLNLEDFFPVGLATVDDSTETVN